MTDASPLSGSTRGAESDITTRPKRLTNRAAAPRTAISLREYYTSQKALPAAAVMAIVRGDVPIADEFESVLQLSRDRDPSLTRTRDLAIALARPATADYMSSIEAFLRQVVEPVLGAVESSEGERPAQTFARLLERQRARLKGTPPRPMWNAVLTVEAILSARGLQIEDSLTAFFTVLAPEQQRSSTKPRLLGKKAGSASALRFWLNAFRPWRERAVDLTRRVERSETVERSLQEEVANQTEEIRTLRQDIATRTRRVEELTRDLDDARTAHHFQDLQLRGRFAGFLQDRLTPLLESAREGLEIRPPRAEHAFERLDDAARAIRDEHQWLNSSG